MGIPKASKVEGRTIPFATVGIGKSEKVVFSFAAVDKTEYFNLDGTCQNWAADLFDTLKTVSELPLSRIYSGEFSRPGSTLRIHRHGKAVPPSPLPEKIDINEMWQIRVAKSKGGIHGLFVDNVFFVIWMDPQHNMYPDERYGGLKKIKPPSSCCLERENDIINLQKENEALKRDLRAANELLEMK